MALIGCFPGAAALPAQAEILVRLMHGCHILNPGQRDLSIRDINTFIHHRPVYDSQPAIAWAFNLLIFIHGVWS